MAWTMRSSTLRRVRKRAVLPLAAGAVLALFAFGLGSPGAGASAVDPANLSVTKSDSPDPIMTGDLLTYTITVSNAGPDAATNVVITDDLPGSVDFVSADTPAAPPASCEKKSGKVICSLGTVANDATATATVKVRVTKKKGTIVNAASVTSDVTDPNTANNLATATTTVTQAPKPPKPKKCSGQAATITGTRGNDLLTGTSGADVVAALGGNDTIVTGRGGDLICAGPGIDRVKGGRGPDTVHGGGSNDRIRGSRGRDQLLGEGGPDRLRGNRGADLLEGGAAFDRCKGGKGRDVLRTCELD
jgi:uncharacterized repeat protein (TIGR01451 family)